jgi:cytochrome c-type biogenesis protein CcsB
MAVNDHLSELSDHLLGPTILTYASAMLAYAVEYAFGRREVGARVAAPARSAVLAGAGGPDVTEGATGTDEPAPPPSRQNAKAASMARAGGRLAVALSVFGWVLHLAVLVTRGLSVHRVPWGNMYEFGLSISFAAVTAFGVFAYRYNVRYLGLFVMAPVVLLLGLAGTVFYVKPGDLSAPLHSYWLLIHVTCAVATAGIFMVGFATASAYLVRDRYDRRQGKAMRFPTTLGRRLPAADALERLTFRVHAVGFPLWTFTIIGGAIWAESAWGRYWGWDPKETTSLVCWVVYAAYLHARSTPRWQGRGAAWLAILGWGVMMFNLFGINTFVVGLHSYAGV